ncbi:histidine--tRNA ligase [Candidatus Nomurabacteria bacterium]|nr:histidine--tRNA ligase [Candidatus Nomurabacteria bacterium]MCB9819104.1 histidine--tRNA ligase [Candidatus Nomurabacteria bacterium]
MAEKLSTEPYKGVRDFYPEDMAVQRHIFDTWSHTAESFGFERYDASVLEPSELYKSKGVENEELVNDQTYTFTDRGDREVTLRPEMTPTVARMIAGRHKELPFPARWYSIPNLFRYERSQRGRVREHWQLNCDLFGAEDQLAADVEMIALAYQSLINFGATEEMFSIRVNDRREMKEFYYSLGVIDEESITQVTRLNDRFHKIERAEYMEELRQIVPGAAEAILEFVEKSEQTENAVTKALNAIGINNVQIDRSLARGFDYYTGTIFEIFDNDPKNNRSMLGGGRYDDLTFLFGDERIGGVGFGMGDVTMRDFLETHDLLPNLKASASLIVVPTDTKFNLDGEKVAMAFRASGVSTLVDISNRKLGKKVTNAAHSGAGYLLVVGEDEIARDEFVLKNLADGTEISGSLTDLAKQIAS